jgi:hypothetical protein
MKWRSFYEATLEYAESSGPIYLARSFDDAGDPVGYRKLSGVEFLGNQEQEECLKRLPGQFTFKQAKAIYGKGDQATSDFLKKCIRLGLVRKVSRGLYAKVHASDPAE